MSINYAQTLTFNLAGSGTNVGDISITLKSFSDIDSAVLTMASFGTKGYGSLEPGTVGQEEAFTFTGVIANVNGTYTLTGVQHQLPQTPYTETVGLRIQHNGGLNVVISNTAGYYSTFTNKNNNETITGSWSIPTPTIAANPVTKAYADGLAIAGAPNASTSVKGIGQVSVAPVSATTPIFVGDNDGRVPTLNQVAAMGTITVAPSAANKFLTQNELNVTSGVISMFAGSVAPSGYFLCNGQAVSRTGANTNLFTVCGTTYGVGDGSTTFNLPNIQGKVPVMIDGTANFLTLGQTGGELTHTLITNEIPSHSHTTSVTNTNPGGSNQPNTGNYQGSSPSVTTWTSNSTGGGLAHNNLQPYLVLSYIIKQ